MNATPASAGSDERAAAVRRGALRDLVLAVVVLVGFFAVASVVFAPAYGILPLEGDNFHVFSWADRTAASAIYAADPGIYPEWRPLAYLTVWLQYQAVGLSTMGPYVVGNLLLLAACAWLVYYLVLVESGSRFGAIAAALFALTDPRLLYAAVWIVERQSSMACLFGLAALVLSERYAREPLGGVPGLLAAGALLVASALSKEYGLAFAGAIGLHALLRRRYGVAAVAAGAVACYAGFRVLAVQGALRQYCESMGYFFDVRAVCVDGVQPAFLPQALYNAGATLVGSLVPGLFRRDGLIALERMRLLVGLLGCGFAVVGWRTRSALLRTALMVVVANAALNFLLYRDRNQFIAVFAIALAIGAGIPASERWMVRTFGRPVIVRVLLATLLLGAVSVDARRTYRDGVAQRARILGNDPCADTAPGDLLEQQFANRVRARYGLAGHPCGATQAKPGA